MRLIGAYRAPQPTEKPTKWSQSRGWWVFGSLKAAIDHARGLRPCPQGPGLVIRRWVEVRAKHKPKKHVVVAAARKLAESIWRLFHLSDAFSPAKAFGG